MSDPRVTQDDLGMMKRPDLWPTPVLPLKRRWVDRAGWETGVLGFVRDGIYLWWPGASMFDLLSPDVAEQIGVSQLDRLIDEGWKVD